jgi:RNA polymerase sigma-70 factor (ECF subfamily)
MAPQQERNMAPAAIAPAAPAKSEEELIRLATRGDQDALEQLFARHNRALYQSALRVLGNPEDAEDALQEGLLSAFRNLRRFEGRSQFSTWLTRIVINSALMRLRSRRSRPAVSLDEEPHENETPLVDRFADTRPSPEQAYEASELRELLSENLEELSPLLRSAFVLREVEGLSTGEAAKELGVSENTLKARLWRARHQLTERLRSALRSPAVAGLTTAAGFGPRDAKSRACPFGLHAVPCGCGAD